MTYPVPPKDLDLLVGNDDPVEPVDGADQENEYVASCSKVRAHADHEQSKKDLVYRLAAQSHAGKT